MADTTKPSQGELVETDPAEIVTADDSVVPEPIRELLDEQNDEAEAYAIEFIKKVIRLRGVAIDREQFLTAELHKRGISRADITEAITTSPAAAGIDLAILDEVAEDSIGFETKKSTAASFVAGLPGGFAMLGTVPADIAQYYVHAFRVMQKLAFVYGWKDLLSQTDEVDDETLGKMAAFLGVMMGVTGATQSLKTFALHVARPAVQKQISKQALTKTAWYVPMKSTLRIIGIHVTKQSFAKTVSKVVPVVGGVVSGGLTFVTLGNQSRRLMAHLRELPPPGVDAAGYLAAIKVEEDDTPDRKTQIVESAVDAGGAAIGAAAKALRKGGKAAARWGKSKFEKDA